jgi:hypothetical protein
MTAIASSIAAGRADAEPNREIKLILWTFQKSVFQRKECRAWEAHRIFSQQQSHVFVFFPQNEPLSQSRLHHPFSLFQNK